MVDKALLLQLVDEIRGQLYLAADWIRCFRVTFDRCYTQVAGILTLKSKSTLAVFEL